MSFGSLLFSPQDPVDFVMVSYVQMFKECTFSLNGISIMERIGMEINEVDSEIHDFGHDI